MPNMDEFEEDLRKAVNRNSMEQGCNLPDHVIAAHLRRAYESLCYTMTSVEIQPPNTHDSETGIKLVNFGHGHVFPRADGALARCGGPGLCAECARDKVKFDALEKSSWVIMVEQTLNEQSKVIKKLQERLEKPNGEE